MKPVISIGNQSFPSIREQESFYIDKTSFIKEWWESRDAVTLITRPRRFGKTLNMSMLEAFFSNQYAGSGHLFEGLAVWQEESYRLLQGSCPLMFLSFASIKSASYEDAREGIIQTIMDLYVKFDFLREGDVLTPKEKAYFDYVNADMSDTAAAMSLHRLALCMNRYYGKKVIILLDEYDTPLQEAYLYGYWDEMSVFIRRLFNATFKTCPYMDRGLMTGITRISKESIFSDLNNLTVITTTSQQYATCFGFTQEEVFQALEQQGLSAQAGSVRKWYDGFTFGSHRDIYNPWSITNFLKEQKLKPYWANTSSNRLAGNLIRESSPDVKIAMEALLSGEAIGTAIDEEIVFQHLGQNDEAVWSLLLACGYLKVEHAPEELDPFGNNDYFLSLTNYEVQLMFRKMFQDWFCGSKVRYNDFVKALLANDVTYMNQYMSQIARETFSFFDMARGAGEREPERFYHGFVLGLIADSKLDYIITSNRESGFGRYDVVMEPKDRNKDAYIFEFKVRDESREKTLEDTVKAALSQIRERDYDAELIARGFSGERIRHYGFAFDGKRVLIG